MDDSIRTCDSFLSKGQRGLDIRKVKRHACTSEKEIEPWRLAFGDATNAYKAYVIFDTGGGPMFEPARMSLMHCGTLIEITSAGDRRVCFDLIDFYHKESRLLGVDTRAYDAVTSSALLEARAFFE